MGRQRRAIVVVFIIGLLANMVDCWNLNMIGYNPLSAGNRDRLLDIKHEFYHADIVALAGTTRKAGSLDVEQQRLEEWTCYSAGWRQAQHSNRSCGVSLLLGKKFKPKHVIKVSSIGDQCPGRGLAVRLKSGFFDLLPMSVYFPPKPTKKAQLKGYQSAVKKIVNWMDEVLSKIPAGCTPLIYTDLNDGVGLQSAGPQGAWTFDYETKCISKEAARKEMWPDGAGESFRKLLERHHLWLPTAVLDPRDTFFGANGSSLIDYVAIPQNLNAEKAGILAKSGRRLQLIEKRGGLTTYPFLQSFGMALGIVLKGGRRRRPRGGTWMPS